MPFAFEPGADYLSPGLHPATVEDVEATLVNGFPGSTTRPEIFARWCAYRAAVGSLVTLREQWLDGSYVTTKLDPGDADIVVHLSGDEVDGLDPAQLVALEALVAGKATKSSWSCDAYPVVEYPAGHPMRTLYENTRDHWLRFFGHDRAGVPKGLVEVTP